MLSTMFSPLQLKTIVIYSSMLKQPDEAVLVKAILPKMYMHEEEKHWTI